MSEANYTLTIEIEDERGSARVKYEGVSREELLKEPKTAPLLRLHEASMPKEEPRESE